MRYFFLVMVSVLSLSFPAFAVDEDAASSGSLSEDSSLESVLVLESPLPVTIVSEEEEYSSVAVYASSDFDTLDIKDVPPSNPPFYGSGYVTGVTDSGQEITLYFPINYRSGFLGVDSSGYLFNVSSTSLSGYFSGVYNNSFAMPGFNYPRYRTSSGSDYKYLSLRPVYSNMEIATSSAGRYSLDTIYSASILIVLGGVFVCLLRKSRS